METFITIIAIAFVAFQVILLAKIWTMTNNVRKLTDHFCEKQERPVPKQLSKEERNNAAKHALGHLK